MLVTELCLAVCLLIASTHCWEMKDCFNKETGTCGEDGLISMNHLLWFCFVVQSLSHVWLSETPWTEVLQASLYFAISWSLLKLMSIESVMPSSLLILYCPLLLLSPIPPRIRVFSNESTLHMRCPKYWSSASASVLPMNTQDWSHLGWTDWIFLQSKGLSRVFSNTTVQNQRSNCQHLVDHQKSKRVAGKHLFLLYWLWDSLWLCGSQ